MPAHVKTDPAEKPGHEDRTPPAQVAGRRLLVALALGIVMGLALMEILTWGLGLRPYSPSVPYVGAALLFASALHYERDLLAALLAGACGFLLFRILDILVHGFLV